MSTTYALFLRWMQAKNIESARQGALKLKVSSVAPVHWKAGRNAEAHIVERMALDLGDDPATHLIAVFLETAKGPNVQTMKRLAKRIGAAAIALALTLPLSPPVTAQDAQGVYIMRSQRPKRRTRRPVAEPDIGPAIHPVCDSEAASSTARFSGRRLEPSTLPQTRSTDERLRSRRVRPGGQQHRRSVRRMGRMAA